MCHLPRHSPMLPVLRDPNALLDRLQARQASLGADGGGAAENARLWARITRVARWQAEVENPRPMLSPPVRAGIRGPACDRIQAGKGVPVRNWLDSLIAEVDVGMRFDLAA